MTLPPSLTDEALAPFWVAVRDRLERNGADSRGRLTIPNLPATARIALDAVAGCAKRRTVQMVDLEQGLIRLGLAESLPAALDSLGFPVSEVRSEQRAARAATIAARAAIRERVEQWPEPWAGEWLADVISRGLLAGFDHVESDRLVGHVRLVLDALEPSRAQPISRVELAARHIGSSHALDTGTRLERAVTLALALAFALSDESDESDGGVGLWERAGAHLDLVSGPALTWNFALAPGHEMRRAVDESNRLGVPFLFTQLSLRRFPVRVEPHRVVLAVENPRVVEFATQRRSATSIICINGNPSAAVRLLFEQLLDGGAHLRYHGDFDAAGLAICGRMFDLGLSPWRMDVDDYSTALDDARRAGVDLPVDRHDASSTPWSPELAEAFNRDRLIVHEERLLADILEP